MERPIRPRAQILEALTGKISEPIETISNKPGQVEQQVAVRIVEEGVGMIGLTDWKDNREWAGIFNHFVKTAGAAVKIGKMLKEKGEDVDVQLLLDTILLSHAGRRQLDEAKWYPEIVVNAQQKSKTADSFLAMPILKERGVDEKVIEMVSVHTLGAENGYRFEDLDNWNKKLPMYLDFRIAQGPMSLAERFADLQRAVDAGRVTQEALDKLHEWAIQTEEELFSIIDLKPEDINEDFLKPERWERYIRRLYVNDAEKDLFREAYMAAEIDFDEFREAERSHLERKFPLSTWFGLYVRVLFQKTQKPYQPFFKNNYSIKHVGIKRAIEFFKYLDTLSSSSDIEESGLTPKVD